ncbi:hypothetical protein Tco_0995783 [Tanacetum coccineum]
MEGKVVATVRIGWRKGGGDLVPKAHRHTVVLALSRSSKAAREYVKKSYVVNMRKTFARKVMVISDVGKSCYVAICTLVWASEVVSSGFLIVKVRRDSKRGPKFTWEHEDHMKANESLLLTPLCLDDIHEVTPRVSALAGCDNSSQRGGLPQNKFFCDVLQYFHIHISRLNPFGCAKLNTFIVMCKAYGCEPTIELFRGFFNSFPGGKWLTFSKRPKKHIPNLFPKVITRIEGWKGRFFFVQDSIVPSTYPELLSRDNKWDKKSFGDKLPENIHKNPSFQRLGRYPTSVRVFLDPVLFLVGLKSSWEYGQQRPAIITDDDLSFLPKEPSLEFGTGSPSVSINAEPPVAEAEPTAQLVENTADLEDSLHHEQLVIHPGSVAARIRERKCRTRGGSLMPLVKRKLVQRASSSRSTHTKAATSKDDSPVLTIYDDDEGLPDCLELEDANACHLKVSAITPSAWKNHLDNQLDVELFDLHDRCYARQAVVDNVVNKMSRELLKVVDRIRAECNVLKDMEKARDQECEELKAKCEAVMANFDKKPAVNVLREKIVSLSEEKLSKPLSIKSCNAKLDWVEVVSNVVPYVAMKLVNSDDMGRLIAKLVYASILFGWCQAFEEVARMKEPFNITKVKGYKSCYKQEHVRVGNELTAATFPFLVDVVADSVEALLSKKPGVLQRPAPTITHMPTSSAPF